MMIDLGVPLVTTAGFALQSFARASQKDFRCKRFFSVQRYR